MSPISSVQQGVVAQYEFAKLLILTSDGQLEPAVPVSDDDTVRKDRLVSDPLFWYAIMCLNLASLGYRDPLFLVNSEEMHRHASPRLIGDIWHFEFFANMSPDSKDRWRPSQVTGKNLGQRVLQVLTEVPLKTAPNEATIQELSQLEHLVWVRRR
jgi:hypothetical protein